MTVIADGHTEPRQSRDISGGWFSANVVEQNHIKCNIPTKSHPPGHNTENSRFITTDSVDYMSFTISIES